MFESQSPPLVEKEWLTAEAISPGGRVRDPGARPDQRDRTRPRTASVHPLHSFGRRGDQATNDRPSVGGRILRSLARFSVAVLIGVGATLAWQSDAAKEMMAAHLPTLAWLLSASAPTVVAAPARQLEPLASNLDAVRRSVEQLAAKQEQLTLNIATLQAVEEDVRQKMSYTPPSQPQQAVPVPQQKPPQPRAQSSAAPSSSASRPPPPAGPILPSR